jgi:hypothetical protein
MNRKRFFIRKILTFVVFALVCTPLEFHLNWMYYVRNEPSVDLAFAKALISGVLFFYSVTISMEAFMRLDGHPQIAGRLEVTILKSLLVVVIIVFMGAFLQFDYRHAQPEKTDWFQISLAIYTLIVASFIHFYVVKAETLTEEQKGFI